MSSLVLELQQAAMDPRARVTDILRKALVVATKLNIAEFKEWVERELHGFQTSDQIPEYRLVNGEIKVHNPYHGWQPVMFDNPSIAERLSERYIGQPIGEMEESVTSGDPKGLFQVPFPPDLLDKFKDSQFMQLGLIPTLIVDRSRFYGIVEAVRNVILEWSLKLERDGIIGDGLTFSREEKQKASTVTYNIHNLTGVAGNVQAHNLQIGDYNSIHPELKRLGVPQDQRNELENILDNLKTTTIAEEKQSLLKRGSEWLMRNAKSLGTLSETIKTWFELLS